MVLHACDSEWGRKEVKHFQFFTRPRQPIHATADKCRLFLQWCLSWTGFLNHPLTNTTIFQHMSDISTYCFLRASFLLFILILFLNNIIISSNQIHFLQVMTKVGCFLSYGWCNSSKFLFQKEVKASWLRWVLCYVEKSRWCTYEGCLNANHASHSYITLNINQLQKLLAWDSTTSLHTQNDESLLFIL